MGTFVTMKTMADGTPRITFDLDCTLAEAAALNWMPGTPAGIARITGESSVEPALDTPVEQSVDTPKPKGGDLARMAGVFCNDPVFWEFLNSDEHFASADKVNNSTEAADLIRYMCNVDSRSEIDHDMYSSSQFHYFFRIPFLAFKEARK
jgi:hypothetical protein